MKSIKLLFFLLITIPLQAQQNNNLHQLIKQHPDSSILLLKLGKSYLFNQPDSAYFYITKSIASSKKFSDQFNLANSLKTLGIHYDIKSQYDSTVYYYLEAASIYQGINNREGYADVLSNLGFTYIKLARYTEALKNMHGAMDIYDSLNASSKMASTLTNVGMLFNIKKDYDKALLNYKKAIESAPENKGNVIRCLVNIGTIYNTQQKYDSALNIYAEAQLVMEERKDLRGLSIIHNNVGNVYSNLENFEEAITQFKLSLDYKEKINNTRGKAITTLNLADAYMKLNQYTQAQEWVGKSLLYSKEVNSKEQILEALLLSAKIDGHLGDHKGSTIFYEKYITLKDSLDEAEQIKEIEEIQEKYKTVERKKEIAELEIQNKQTQLDAQENANQRNILILVAVIILIGAVLLILLLRSKSKTNRVISESLSEKETLLREIHHRVKNNLQVISSLLNLQMGSLDNEEALEAVKQGQNRVKSMALIHQKLYQNTDLKGIDIEEYIEQLVAELFQSFGIDNEKITYSVNANELKLDIDTVIPLGLILNELITNSLKYAFNGESNGELSISLVDNNDQLELVVKDNGKGIDEEAMEKSNSFGWKMIRSLGRKLKADIDVVNENGTSVQLNISRYKLAV